MAKIKGSWLLNEVFTFPDTDIRQTVNFTTNQTLTNSDGASSNTFRRMQILGGENSGTLRFDYWDTDRPVEYYNVHWSRSWQFPEYDRIVHFGDTEQDVDDVFYICITANAKELTSGDVELPELPGMKKIKGIWRFDTTKTPTLTETGEIRHSVNFCTDTGNSCSEIVISKNGIDYRSQAHSSSWIYYKGQGWRNHYYDESNIPNPDLILDFGTVEQYVADDCYEFITSLMYEITRETTYISGCWQFKERVELPDPCECIYQKANIFLGKNNKKAIGLLVYVGQVEENTLVTHISARISEVYYDTTGLVERNDSWWDYNNVRIVDFGDEPQLVYKRFADYITTNADPVDRKDYWVKVTGVWKWNDKLRVTNGMEEFSGNFKVNGINCNIAAVGYPPEDYIHLKDRLGMVIGNVENDETAYASLVYMDDVGWLDGSINSVTYPEPDDVKDTINESHLISSDKFKIWDFGTEGVIMSKGAYLYLAENAKAQDADSVKAKIKNLIAKANVTTGGSYTDLTKAVKGLCAGYGEGAIRAAGLYQTGTDNLITPWADLLAAGVIHVENGVVYTNVEAGTITNNSSAYLAGDLVIPDDGSVTAIGDEEFETLVSERAAFAFCEELTAVTIPECVTKFGACAFAGCRSLTKINIPDSIETVGVYSLAGCPSLRELHIKSLNTWSRLACGLLPTKDYEEETGSILPLQDYLYIRGSKATDLDITVLNDVGAAAFAGANNVKSLSIMHSFDETVLDGSANIGAAAFAACQSLETAEIRAALVTMGIGAFTDCPNLESINIEAETIIMCVDAIQNCKNLKKVVFDADYLIFGGESDILKGLPSITSIGHTYDCDMVLPYNVGYMFQSGEFDGAFAGCTNLKKVKLDWSPGCYGGLCADCVSLTSVGPGSDYDYEIPREMGALWSDFPGCTGLVKVVIPDWMYQINGSFWGCTNLKSVTILGKSLNANAAFQNCPALTDIYYVGTEEEWAGNVVLDAEVLSNVTVHYNYVPEEG